MFFLKLKSEVAVVFERFKVQVEKQSGLSIKNVRSDNGSEYTSNEFEKICREAGIIHQFSCPYTPQQNGVSERKNRTVMEMARCMVAEKGLPKSFWAEAVNTVVYLLNRLPTKALTNQTPYEAWYGMKPSVRNLKIFGSVCYALIPIAKRSKLDEKALTGVFIGYSEQSKAYRVYDPAAKKIHITRDVRVDEKGA